MSFILFLSPFAQAKTRLVFLELRDAHGELVQYEPGGRFAHTAIQFEDIGDQWLNSYPGEGVALVSWEKLQHRGTVVEIIEIPQTIHLFSSAALFGKAFLISGIHGVMILFIARN